VQCAQGGLEPALRLHDYDQAMGMIRRRAEEDHVAVRLMPSSEHVDVLAVRVGAMRWRAGQRPLLAKESCPAIEKLPSSFLEQLITVFASKLFR
jgi:hypothetical protein